MTTTAEAAPARKLRRPWATLWTLRLTLLLHSALVVAQPILAGYYLAGEVDAMASHSPIGSTLWLITLLFQLPAAILYWMPGGGRLWPALVTVLLVFAELAQNVFGHLANFAVHIPLGTGIVVAVVAMTVWSFRSHARLGRKEITR